MVLFYHTLVDLLQITFQSLGESNPFSLREGQVYYLYTKGPVVIVSQFFCYAEKKNNEKQSFFISFCLWDLTGHTTKRKAKLPKKKRSKESNLVQQIMRLLCYLYTTSHMNYSFSEFCLYSFFFSLFFWIGFAYPEEIVLFGVLRTPKRKGDEKSKHAVKLRVSIQFNYSSKKYLVDCLIAILF